MGFFVLLFLVNLNYAFNPDSFPSKNYSIFVSVEKLESCKELKKNGDSAYNISMPPLQAEVKFTGNFRIISVKKMEFLKRFSTAIQKPLYNDYKEEFEIEDGLFKYWIPIQNQTLKTFKPSAKKGSRIRLYMRNLGCLMEDMRSELVTILIAAET